MALTLISMDNGSKQVSCGITILDRKTKYPCEMGQVAGQNFKYLDGAGRGTSLPKIAGTCPMPTSKQNIQKILPGGIRANTW